MVGARRCAMDRARDELLARAVLAEYQHCCLGAGDLLDITEQSLDRGRAADDLHIGRADVAAQLAPLRLEIPDGLRGLAEAQRRTDGRDELLVVPWLHDEIRSAFLDRLHRGLDAAVSSH